MAAWSCRSALWHRMTNLLNAKKYGLLWIWVKPAQRARQARHKQTFTLPWSILFKFSRMSEKPCKTLLRRDNFAETSPQRERGAQHLYTSASWRAMAIFHPLKGALMNLLWYRWYRNVQKAQSQVKKYCLLCVAGTSVPLTLSASSFWFCQSWRELLVYWWLT